MDTPFHLKCLLSACSEVSLTTPEYPSGLAFQVFTRGLIHFHLLVLGLDAALEQTQDSDMQEATDLIMKALRRLPTDKPGAITACTTACESVCRIALERLRLPLPKSKQLPDYLKTLCRQSNIRALAGFGGEGTRRVFGNLQGLAQNSYRAAHELGDRHAGGDSASEPSAFAASLLVTSCATLTIITAGATARNEIELTH